MGILHRTEEVRFNVRDQQHRQSFAKFRQERSWKNAPRYILEDGYACIPSMIVDKMLDYYLTHDSNHQELN